MPIDISKEKLSLSSKAITEAMQQEAAGLAMAMLFDAWDISERDGYSRDFAIALIGELISARELMKTRRFR